MKRKRKAPLPRRSPRAVSSTRGARTLTVEESTSIDVDSATSSARFLRPRDHLLFVLRWDPNELELVEIRTPVHLRRIRADAVVSIEFPPQHLAEETFQAVAEGDPSLPSEMRARARLANETTLSFRLPPELTKLPLTLRDVLGFADWPLVLRRSLAREPRETRIEAPARVTIAPLAEGQPAFEHRRETPGPRTEQWYTQIKWHPTAGDGAHRMRVLETRPGPNPFDWPSVAGDRTALVAWDQRAMEARATGAPDWTDFLPKLEQLVLTTDGASLHFHGVWPASQAGLTQWKHRMAVGRDALVEIAHAGFNYPVGHQVAHVIVTTRERDRATGRAFLRKRHFLQLREPLRTYQATRVANEGREWPFASLRFVTQTVEVDPPSFSPDKFWFRPMAGGRAVRFSLEGCDANRIAFPLAGELIFIKQPEASEAAAYANALNDVAHAYKNSATRRAVSDGTLVALAEQYQGERPAFRLESLDLDANLQVDGFDGLGFAPRIESARVRIRELECLANESGIVDFRYYTDYVQRGFASQANKGKVWAELLSTRAVDLASDALGVTGICAPSLSFASLAAGLGPAGKAADVALGSVRPEDLLGEGAKLLGCVPLKSILGPLALDKLPKSLTVPIEPSPRRAVKLEWKGVPLSSFGPFVVAAERPATLEVTAILPIDGRPAGRLVTVELSSFRLKFPLLTVRFGKLALTSVDGNPPTLDPQIDGFDLGPELTFIGNLLQAFTPSGARGLFIRPSPTQIVAGMDLRLPDLGFGIFSILDFGMSWELRLPLSRRPPEVVFSIGTENAPFRLTVGLFAGAGYLGFAVQPSQGSLELSGFGFQMEFGGGMALNLFGVVSGSASVRAGFYLSRGTFGHRDRFYLRASGCVRVLGLLTVSVDFYLGLTRAPGVLIGEARLTVSIEFLFFSASVTVPVRRELPTSSGRLLATDTEGAPSFRQEVARDAWKEYARAFA
jgi:hypothetical protein